MGIVRGRGAGAGGGDRLVAHVPQRVVAAVRRSAAGADLGSLVRADDEAYGAAASPRRRPASWAVRLLHGREQAAVDARPSTASARATVTVAARQRPALAVGALLDASPIVVIGLSMRAAGVSMVAVAAIFSPTSPRGSRRRGEKKVGRSFGLRVGVWGGSRRVGAGALAVYTLFDGASPRWGRRPPPPRRAASSHVVETMIPGLRGRARLRRPDRRRRLPGAFALSKLAG